MQPGKILSQQDPFRAGPDFSAPEKAQNLSPFGRSDTLQLILNGKVNIVFAVFSDALRPFQADDLLDQRM